jgi:hypothetical protein
LKAAIEFDVPSWLVKEESDKCEGRGPWNDVGHFFDEATAMGELNQARTRVETGCTNAQTDLDSATNAKVQADQARGQATAAKATAEAALVQAQTAQNLAQAAVLAVCPDYAV